MSAKALLPLTLVLPVAALVCGNPFLGRTPWARQAAPSTPDSVASTPIVPVPLPVVDELAALDAELRPLVREVRHDADGRAVLLLLDGRVMRRGNTASPGTGGVVEVGWVLEPSAVPGLQEQDDAHPDGGQSVDRQ
ncbi:MAG: hypothetical protein JNK78_17035 [Planctomycetes bacterium]|nr:hypothetical protein [Planctomycetota bacterium]